MSRVILAICVTLWMAPLSLAAISVTAEVDKKSVRVGEQIRVTVRALRTIAAEEPTPSHAGLQLGPEWETGAQTAESERSDSTGLVKTWHFELTAVTETTSTITPVVILAASPHDGFQLATNRVLGPPLEIAILPAKVRPWWLPRLRTLAIIAGLAATAFAIVRALRRRIHIRPRPTLSPYQEAMAMMEEVHADCREDRASRFFADVERVLSGYLSRRLGRSLGSATAREIAALTASYITDAATIADLQSILSRCTTARFSGAKVEFRVLAETEESTRSVLERLDRLWVTDTPASGASVGESRS